MNGAAKSLRSGMRNEPNPERPSRGRDQPANRLDDFGDVGKALADAGVGAFLHGDVQVFLLCQISTEDHHADGILKCAGKVGRRDDEAVAGALNEPLFEVGRRGL